MAYDFVDTSSQYLSTSSTPVTAAPLTIAAWAVSDSDAKSGVLLSVTRTNRSDQFQIQMAGTVASDPVRFLATENAVNAQDGSALPASAAYTVGVFSHCAGTRANTTTAAVFLNAVKTQITTNSITPQSVSAILIGARSDFAGGGASFLDGRVAEAAIWSVVLTDAEITSLAKGFKPSRIRPQSLVFYAPLIRNLQDIDRGITLTNNNGATVANHPRVY